MQGIRRLVETMKRLRDPGRGCPWDRAQDWRSLVSYSLEEVYELAEAVDRDDAGAVRDELGDLLFHIVFYSRIAEEAGRFTFDDVAAGVVAKLRRRHPHVFGDNKDGEPPSWERLKAEERAGQGGPEKGLLDGVAETMPAMVRALTLQKRAASVGFDWPGMAPVLDKVDEEVAELREAAAGGGPAGRIGEELGDLLFAAVNLARHAGVDPETAL